MNKIDCSSSWFMHDGLRAMQLQMHGFWQEPGSWTEGEDGAGLRAKVVDDLRCDPILGPGESSVSAHSRAFDVGSTPASRDPPLQGLRIHMDTWLVSVALPLKGWEPEISQDHETISPIKLNLNKPFESGPPEASLGSHHI